MLGQLIQHYIGKMFVKKFGCPKADFGMLHWQGDSLAYSLLITALYFILSNGQPKLGQAYN